MLICRVTLVVSTPNGGSPCLKSRVPRVSHHARSYPTRNNGAISATRQTKDQDAAPRGAVDQAWNSVDALRKEGVAVTVSMLSSFLQDEVSLCNC